MGQHVTVDESNAEAAHSDQGQASGSVSPRRNEDTAWTSAGIGEAQHSLRADAHAFACNRLRGSGTPLLCSGVRDRHWVRGREISVGF